MRDRISQAPLTEFATITMGQSPDSACVDINESGLPFLQGCAEFGARVPSAKFHCSPPLRIAKAGSILISVRAPVGSINIADRDYCIGRGLAAVNAKLGIADNMFLLNAIANNVGFLHRRSQGSTFLAVGSKDLLQLPIPRMGIKAQHRIGEVFSTIDNAIADTEALITKFEQIRAGMIRDMFTRGVQCDGKLRPRYSEAPSLYRESPLGWIPKDWAIYPLSSVADTLIDGPFGTNLKTEHYVVDAGVRVVRLQNVKEGMYDDEDRAFVSERHARYLARHKVTPGDVLIAALGDESYPVGRACTYPDDLPPAINKADCYRLRCRSELAINSYVMHFLNTPLARKQVRRFEQGVTRRRVNLGNMRRVVVPLPKIDKSTNEQSMVVERLAAVSTEIETASMLAAKLRLEKFGLMNDLLSGIERDDEKKKRTK